MIKYTFKIIPEIYEIANWGITKITELKRKKPEEAKYSPSGNNLKNYLCFIKVPVSSS